MSPFPFTFSPLTHYEKYLIAKKEKCCIVLHLKLAQVAEGARARGASRIIGVDINSDKFIKGNFLFHVPLIPLCSLLFFYTLFLKIINVKTYKALHELCFFNITML